MAGAGAFQLYQPTPVTGSVRLSEVAQITGSVKIDEVANITGSVGLTEIATLTGSTYAITGSVKIDEVANITGSVGLTEIAQLTGSVYSVTGTIGLSEVAAITGTVGLSEVATITGSVGLSEVASITGSVSLSEVATVTGSFGLTEIAALTGSTYAITGSVGLSEIAQITGSIGLSEVATITGSVGLSEVATVTGSVKLSEIATITGTIGLSEVASITGTVGLSEVATITGSVRLSETSYISFAKTPNVDLFSRLRTSNLNLIFSSQPIFDALPGAWESITSSVVQTITHVSNEGAVALAIDDVENSFAYCQTKRYWRCVPGQNQQVFMSFLFKTPETNLIQRVGYFDDNDGVFLAASGSDLKMVRRSSASGALVETEVTQATWNIDSFDGNGPSSLTLDVTKVQTIVFDVQWLASGTIRVGFVVNGQIIYAHEFALSNSSNLPFVKSMNLPLRYEIRNIGGATTGASTIKQYISSIFCEGDKEKTFLSSIDKDVSPYSATTTLTSLLSLRLRSTHNHLFVEPESIFLVNGGNFATAGILHWKLLLNPTTGSALEWFNAGPTSEYSTGNVAITHTTSSVLGSGYVYISSSAKTYLKDINLGISSGSILTGDRDFLCLAVQVTNDTTNCLGSFGYRSTY